MVDAVSSCLRRLSLSLDRHRSLGCVLQLTSFLGDSLAKEAADTVASTPAEVRGGPSSDNRRKRGTVSNVKDKEDDIHDDDPDEEGGGACVDPSTSGTNKKAKTEQLACPFRKFNPLRHNCREWEYCSKAPFRNMSELKYVSTLQTSKPDLLTTRFTEDTSSGTTVHPSLASGALDATRPFPTRLTGTNTSGRRVHRYVRRLTECNRQASHRTERSATALKRGFGAEWS